MPAFQYKCIKRDRKGVTYLFHLIPSVCTFSPDLQIRHHLILFTLKKVFLLKMKVADGFASKFTLSDRIVLKLLSRSDNIVQKPILCQLTSNKAFKRESSFCSSSRP